jgi:hypothetical protein
MGLPIGQEARKRQRIAAHRHHHRLRAGQGKCKTLRRRARNACPGGAYYWAPQIPSAGKLAGRSAMQL